MTMQKLVSGSRLFTISPRFKVLESLQRASLAQEILRSLSDATQPTRFAFIRAPLHRSAGVSGISLRALRLEIRTNPVEGFRIKALCHRYDSERNLRSSHSNIGNCPGGLGGPRTVVTHATAGWVL